MLHHPVFATAAIRPIVIAGHGRSKNGVASTYVPAIHFFLSFGDKDAKRQCSGSSVHPPSRSFSRALQDSSET